MKLIEFEGSDGTFLINPEQVISVRYAALPGYVQSAQRKLGITTPDTGGVYIETTGETYIAIGTVARVGAKLKLSTAAKAPSEAADGE